MKVKLLRPAQLSYFGPCRRSRCLCGLETHIRAKKGSGLAEISAIQEIAPPEGWRRLSLETNLSGLCGGTISALAVDQRRLSGLEARICVWKSSADAEISVLHWQGRTTHRDQCIYIF